MEKNQVLEGRILENKDGLNLIKKIHKIIRGTFVIGGFGMLGFFGYSMADDFVKTRPLANYRRTEIRDVKEGDTYSGYALNLFEKYPCIKSAGIKRMSDYLKHNVNGGAELIQRKKVNLPIYNCTK